MTKKIEILKNKLASQMATKGCVKFYPDNLKEEALVLHAESNMSLNKFSELLGISPFTLRAWRHFFEFEKPKSKYPNFHRMKDPDYRPRTCSRKIKINPNSLITLSDAETRESMLAKKMIRNKERYNKLKKEKLRTERIEAKKELSVPANETENKKDVAEDIKIYLSRSIDAAIPIVNTRGDVIPKMFRDMQEEWLKNNKPKKYSGGGTLLEG